LGLTVLSHLSGPIHISFCKTDQPKIGARLPTAGDQIPEVGGQGALANRLRMR